MLSALELAPGNRIHADNTWIRMLDGTVQVCRSEMPRSGIVCFELSGESEGAANNLEPCSTSITLSIRLVVGISQLVKPCSRQKTAKKDTTCLMS